MDVVRATLIADPRCLLWRNEIGASTHFPDGTLRRAPIRYGLASPGGADLIGFYGPRFLAVECKTVRGTQSPEQVAFERCVLSRGGIYAIARGEDDGRALREWLAAGGVGQLPEQLRGGGSLQTATTTTA